LLDENLSPRLKDALLRYNSEIDIVRVGDERTPALGTAGPDILGYAAQQQRLFITENRKSMPAHVTELIIDGKHTWGVIRISERATFGTIIEEPYMI